MPRSERARRPRGQGSQPGDRGGSRWGQTAAQLLLSWGGALSLGSAALAGPAARDLQAAAEMIEAVHPAPWLWLEQEDWQAALEAELTSLEADSGPDDLRAALARQLALLGDRHILMLPGDPAALEGGLTPVLLAWTEQGVLVDASAQPLPTGTLLVSLNGEPIEALWEALQAGVAVDGLGADRQRLSLDRSFPLHYLWSRGAQEEFTLELRLPDGSLVEERWPGLGVGELQALSAQRHSLPYRGGPPDPWPRMESLGEGAWLLRLTRFGNPDEAQWMQSLEEALEPLGRRDLLVVDLRGNEGGFRHYGAALQDRLLGAVSPQWERVSTRTLELPEAWDLRPLMPGAAGPGEPFRQLEPEGGRWTWEGDPMLLDRKHRGRAHRGELLLLIDEQTSSAAAELAAGLLHARPETRVLGQESGGGCAGHMGQYPAIFRSPELGVELMLSLYAIDQVSTRGCEPGRGIQPDRRMPRRLEALLAEEDPYLGELREAGWLPVAADGDPRARSGGTPLDDEASPQAQEARRLTPRSRPR